MGLLDSAMGAAAPQMSGGLLGAAPTQGGVPPMPPDMAQAVENMKNADPEAKQQFIEQVAQKIQSSGKDPQMIKQVLAQFMQAMQS